MPPLETVSASRPGGHTRSGRLVRVVVVPCAATAPGGVACCRRPRRRAPGATRHDSSSVRTAASPWGNRRRLPRISCGPLVWGQVRWCTLLRSEQQLCRTENARASSACRVTPARAEGGGGRTGRGQGGRRGLVLGGGVLGGRGSVGVLDEVRGRGWSVGVERVGRKREKRTSPNLARDHRYTHPTDKQSASSS